MTFAFFRAAWAAMKLVPWWVYAIAALAFSFYSYGLYEHHQGAKDTAAKYDKQIAAERAAYAEQVAAIKAEQQTVITQTVIEYRDRVKVIKEKGDEIVKEVPVYVPLDSPLLASGVRVFHDAATTGDVPDDPIGAIAAADPVTAASLMETVATNYTACRADQERLASLQHLVSALGAKP
jgi:hypothetical protein